MLDGNTNQRTSGALSLETENQLTPVEAGRESFVKLIDAIRRDDEGSIEALRAHWGDIREYARSSSIPEKDLPGEKREALILWLATEPSPAPMDWDRSSKMHVSALNERGQYLAMTAQLWADWSNPTHFAVKLGGALSGMERQRQATWMANARKCFNESITKWFASQNEESKDPQVRLDVVAGFSASLEQAVLSQRQNVMKAKIEVRGYEKVPDLQLAGTVNVSMDALGAGIAFRSGIEQSNAQSLAAAITLSLPLHGDVLANFSAEMCQNACILSSTRIDPFEDMARLKPERLTETNSQQTAC